MPENPLFMYLHTRSIDFRDEGYGPAPTGWHLLAGPSIPDKIVN